MRILFWSLSFWPQIGGLEILAAKQLSSLRLRGHEFIVVAPKSYGGLPDEERYQGIPIHRLEFESAILSGIEYVTEVRKKLIILKRTFAPDLIHINGVGPVDFFHLTTRNAHKAPVAVTLHNPWPSRADSIVEQTLHAADWVVGVSAAILDRALQLTPEINGRSSVIYNSVAPPLPDPKPLPFSQPRLLCLGRLVPEKGIDVAIDAFSLILQRFPHARLTIAGNGPLRCDLEKQVIRLGISHAVSFIGWVVPGMVPSLLNDYTIVLMPSRQEPFGLVALESALMARPVIATRVGGLPEIVVNKQTGLLVENEDSRSLAQAAALLLSDPVTATRLGQAARRRAQDVFGWERHISEYDALYRRLTQ
jgi:glycogen(starch) synthase